ncbi:MAG: hypothetical protein NXY59_00535 [Aigarchaeota archaeon]|nr:hypothetical protein [Candidatus Pelearchaeum maunauluense]
MFKKLNVESELIQATIKINEKQPQKIIQLIKNMLGSLRYENVAVLGLAFKAGTDDIRNSVIIKIIRELKANGAKIRVYDPKAIGKAKTILGQGIKYSSISI